MTDEELILYLEEKMAKDREDYMRLRRMQALNLVSLAVAVAALLFSTFFPMWKKSHQEQVRTKAKTEIMKVTN